MWSIADQGQASRKVNIILGGDMYYFKGCERSGGDLYIENDGFGTYVGCMQCGAVVADFGVDLPKGTSITDALALVTPSQNKSA